MLTNPTLTADEFKLVHNGLCEVRAVSYQMTGVISETLSNRLTKAIEQIEEGLESAYVQDNELMDHRSTYFESIAKMFNLNSSCWSMFEVENMFEPSPFPSVSSIRYKGKDTPIDISEGCVVRWLDLYIAADRAIQQSGDTHHIFIEAFTPVENEPGVLLLQTGS